MCTTRPTKKRWKRRRNGWENRPRTTHGPFIGVEAASPRGSKEHEHFLAAYRYAFQMARSLNSPHMVIHTHQRVIQAHERDEARQMCMESIRELLDLSTRYGCSFSLKTWIFRRRGCPSLTRTPFWNCWNAFPKPGASSTWAICMWPDGMPSAC